MASNWSSEKKADINLVPYHRKRHKCSHQIGNSVFSSSVDRWKILMSIVMIEELNGCQLALEGEIDVTCIFRGLNWVFTHFFKMGSEIKNLIFANQNHSSKFIHYTFLHDLNFKKKNPLYPKESKHFQHDPIIGIPPS